jgi:short-subunit dehydrogenase
MSFALVTGAAKGIGRAIAEELAIRKYHLILVDKDADELYASTRKLRAAIVQVIPLHIDLTAADGVEQLISFTQPYHEWLNVVVNNAGYGLRDSFEQISISDQLNIIEFNIKALVKISHAYIPVLKNPIRLTC